MQIELRLDFPDAEHVVVSYKHDRAGPFPFVNPRASSEMQMLAAFLDSYIGSGANPPASAEGREVATRFPIWGQRLFDAVFHEQDARVFFDRFYGGPSTAARVVTIAARHASVHSLPWELMRVSFDDGPLNFRMQFSMTTENQCTSLGVVAEPPEHAASTRARQPIASVWPALRQARNTCAILAQRYWRRLMVRGRKLLTTHRFGRLVLLVLEPFTGRLHDFTTAGALLRRAASPLGAPFTAASMLGVAVRYAVGRFMAVMPGMDGMPAGQILQLADGVRWRAQYGATAVAFVGIIPSRSATCHSPLACCGCLHGYLPAAASRPYVGSYGGHRQESSSYRCL